MRPGMPTRGDSHHAWSIAPTSGPAPRRATSCRRRPTRRTPSPTTALPLAAGRPSFGRPTTIGVKPEHAHRPLVVMLVLTQLSVGGFLVELAARLAGLGGGADRCCCCRLCLGLGYAGPGGEPAPSRPAALRVPGDPRAAALVAEPRGARVRALRQAGDRSSSRPRCSRRAGSRVTRGCESALLASVVASGAVRRGLLGDGLPRRPPAVLAGIGRAASSSRERPSCWASPRRWRAWAFRESGRPAARQAPPAFLRPLVAGALIARVGGQAVVRGRRPSRRDAAPSSSRLRRTARLLRGPLKRPARAQAAPRRRGRRASCPLLAIVGTALGRSAVGCGCRRSSRWPASIGGELIERYLVLPRGHAAEDAGGAAVMKTARRRESLLGRAPVAGSREGRPADPRAAARAGPVRAGPGPRRQDPRRDDGDGLRLLLDGLRPDRPPPRRRGGQPEPDDRLPGQPRHGLPQGLGGPDRSRRPRPRDGPPAAGRGRPAARRSTGTPR